MKKAIDEMNEMCVHCKIKRKMYRVDLWECECWDRLTKKAMNCKFRVEDKGCKHRMKKLIDE